MFSRSQNSAMPDTGPDPAPKLFEDRRKLMEMFDDDLDEMLTPVPTYTYALKPFFSLNYSENDVLAICNMQSHEVDQSEYQNKRHYHYLELLNEYKTEHEQAESVLYSRYEKTERKVIDIHAEIQQIIDNNPSASDGSDDNASDEDIETKLQRLRGRERSRSSEVFAATEESMSLEAFHQKITWEKWTGNGKSPRDMQQYLLPHEPTACGVNIIPRFKPPFWQQQQTYRRSVFTTPKAKTGEAADTQLSFVDFMRSVPIFHKLSLQELSDLEKSCTMQAFSDKEYIISEGQRPDMVYVIRNDFDNVSREGKVLSQNQRAMCNGIYLTRGDYFGDAAVTRRVSTASYSTEGDVLLICIPPSIFESILATKESGVQEAIGADQEPSPEELSLTTHIQRFLEILVVFQQLKNKKELAKRRSTKRGEFLPQQSPNATLKTPRPSLRQNAPQLTKAASLFGSVEDNVEDSKSDSETDAKSFPNSSRPSSGKNSNAPAVAAATATSSSDAAKAPNKRAARRGSVLQFSASDAPGTAHAQPGNESSGDAELSTEENYDLDTKNQSLMLELLTSLSPELTFDDSAEHMVRLVREFFGVDRVGFFLVDWEKNMLLLKVSQDGSGFRVPLKGIAGHVAKSGQTVNLEDCYEDERFDPAMDMRTGYRTKQMLCLPVHGRPGQVVGVLQLINTLDDTPFNAQEVKLAEMCATQIGSVLTTLHTSVSKMGYTPIYKVQMPFRLRLGYALFKKSHNHLKCTMQILHGGIQIGPTLTTDLRETTSLEGMGTRRCDFNMWMQVTDMSFSQLPQGCRIIFNLYSKNNHPVGWCGLTLFTFDQTLKTGEKQLHLWDGECPSPSVPALQNISSEAEGRMLTIELPAFDTPIVYEVKEKSNEKKTPTSSTTTKSLQWYLSRMSPIEKARFIDIMNDPISMLSASDKQMIWKLRESLIVEPTYLPKFLLSVNWFDPDAVREAYRLLYLWEIPEYVQALQILDQRYPEPKVRAFAVQLLGALTDEELLGYMLQLTQLIKFEPFHDSALVRFLLRRALGNPEKIGHTFFWYLRAEMHVKEVSYRYGLLLRLFMRTCGSYRTSLGHQMLVMRRLEEVAVQVQKQTTKEERLAVLRERLSQTDFPSSFQLPLNPNLTAKGIIVNKCRVMESKKKPLWLTFENAIPGGKPIIVMFKAGDDLRQDQLTLQVLSAMDRLWKKDDLDLHMSAYGCISTGNEIGMLEIVGNSATLANIVASCRNDAEAGTSAKKIMAALDALYSVDVLQNWLMLNNIDPLNSRRVDPPLVDRAGNPRPRRNALSGPPSIHSLSDPRQCRPAPSGLDMAREKFLKSCAGYCVATFVMGIGDRHNDNIMMKRTGELFHIDFGHFLGNFKFKYGIKRERAPFVFTPAFAAVLGGTESPMYREFERLACDAFNILRKNSSLLVTLFSLMVSCGIPELQREEDIAYLRDNLMILETDEVASQRFRELISQCLNTRATQLNDAAHLLVHA